MMLLGILIITSYIFITSILGTAFLKKLNISIFNNRLSDYVVGFIFMEMFCFLFFLVGVGIFKIPFWFSFLPIFLAGISYAANFKLNVKNKLNYKKKYIIHILIVFLGFISIYIFDAYTHIASAITNSGVIYQDVIYHSGISNAMVEFGYPVKDLQYDGGIISYHIFTHFVAAQWILISGWQGYQIFILVFYSFFALALAIFIYDASLIVLKEKFRSHKYIIVALITFLGGFFLGGNLSTRYLASYYFSYSFQWQLLLLIISTVVIINSKDNIFTLKDYSILLILFCFSILAKGSSLPLLLMGYGFLALHKIWVYKRIIISDIMFLSVCTLFGSIIYLFFFSTDSSVDFTTLFGFNSKIANITIISIILNKLKLDTFLFMIIGLFLTIISYRFVLIKFIKNSVVVFSLGMFISGILFFLFYTRDPFYFLVPTIFISNFIFSLYFVKDFKNILIYKKIIILILILLSIYPIASYGFGMKTKLAFKSEKYFPFSIERLSLYDFLKNNTNKDDIIFTPSVYSTNDYIADNYYPAALSSRSFYLGGYRFGNLKYHNDFEERQNFVDNFSVSDSSSYQSLEKLDVKIILIESFGNKRNITNYILGNNNMKYELMYKNSAGIILKLKQ